MEGMRLREPQTESATQVRGAKASAEQQPFIPDANTTLRCGNKPSKSFWRFFSLIKSKIICFLHGKYV